jgi:hypothetical protein
MVHPDRDSGGGHSLFAIGGWRGGLGFLLGGGIAYLNFHWLKRTVDALGDTAGGRPPSAKVAVVLGPAATYCWERPRMLY